MAKPREITMRDVASQSKVTVATVSRALRNHPSISMKTRRRVQRIAARLGYTPNPLVGALMTRIRASQPATTVNLACLYDSPHEVELIQGQNEFLRGVETKAQQLGYAVEFQQGASTGKSGDEVARVWKVRGIRGIIFSHFRLPFEDFTLPWEDFAWVVVGHSIGVPEFHRVANHIYAIVKLALKELHRRGYSRPGLAVRLHGPNRSGLRWYGAFEANRLPRVSAKNRIPPFGGHHNKANFAKWLQRHRPDVVVSLEDRHHEWLKELGYRIPDDIGFLHLGANASAISPSGIHQNFREVGFAAVHSLDSQLRRNETGVPATPTSFAVDGSWQEGTTLRPR